MESGEFGRQPAFTAPAFCRFVAVLLLGGLFFSQSISVRSQLCPTRCGSSLNISYPFGAVMGCGLPDFLLNCTGDQVKWTPFNVTTSTLYVLNISLSSYTSGVMVVTEDSMKTNCGVEDMNIEELKPKFWSSKGANFHYYDTSFLFFQCNLDPPSMTAKLAFQVSTPYCVNFYNACFSNGTDQTEENCIQIDASNENLTWIAEEYQCKYYTAIYNASSGLSSSPSFGIELEWALSGYDKNCTACVNSGGNCGYNVEDLSFRCFCENDGFSKTICMASLSANDSCTNHLCTRSAKLALSVGVLGLVATIVVFFVFCIRRWDRKAKNSIRNYFSDDASRESVQILANQVGPLPTKLFAYKELLEATKSFSESRLLGDGGFGAVYEGRLYDGRKVAVKRLYQNNYRKVEQFFNEIRILSSLEHPYLVKLHGFCYEYQKDLLLVYEFVSNGTLADHLHGNEGKGLRWESRLSIALETAQALSYLHFSVNPPVFHRDVKSSNILLDENFHVKVADFGLSRLVPMHRTHVSTAPQGTPGYLDPDYHESYQLTDKSDVYSLGVVLMEIISGKLPVDTSRDRGEVNLCSLAISKIQ
eukprot:c28592_g1_i1 orf=191-1954(+)